MLMHLVLLEITISTHLKPHGRISSSEMVGIIVGQLSKYLVQRGPFTFYLCISSVQSIQLLSHVQLFVTPWTTAHQASLTITNSQSPPKPMSIESEMPSNHFILCCPLLLPSILPSIRVFSNESALHIRWPKYWSCSFNISLGWISLQSKGLSRVFSNTTVQKHQFFGAHFSLLSNSHIHTWLLEKP